MFIHTKKIEGAPAFCAGASFVVQRKQTRAVGKGEGVSQEKRLSAKWLAKKMIVCKFLIEISAVNVYTVMGK